MATYLVTGSSRGIGLELVRQLLELPTDQVSHVFAVTRGPSPGIQDLIDSSTGRVSNVILEDISNEASVRKGMTVVDKALSGKGLDVLVNNAGVMESLPGTIEILSGDKLREVLNVNTVSAQVMTAGFLQLLEKSGKKKIINISSTLGSIAMIKGYSWARSRAYQISKAGMNMLTALWAMDLEPKGFTVVAISPGWLKTDLGSQNADLEVSVGVAKVIDMIINVEPSMTGSYLNIHVPGYENQPGPNKYDGKVVPW